MNNQNVLQLPPYDLRHWGGHLPNHPVKTSLNIAVVPKLCQDIPNQIPQISCNFLLVTHQTAFSHWHKYCSTFLPLPAILQLSHQVYVFKT